MDRPQATSVGARRLGTTCAGRRALTFICLLPDSGALASFQLEVRWMVMVDAGHSHSQLCAAPPALRVVRSTSLPSQPTRPDSITGCGSATSFGETLTDRINNEAMDHSCDHDEGFSSRRGLIRDTANATHDAGESVGAIDRTSWK